jgi:hypothetical protein
MVDPSGAADQVVVVQEAAVRVELDPPAGGDRVHPALGVGQLHAVTRPEWPAPQARIDRRHEIED